MIAQTELCEDVRHVRFAGAVADIEGRCDLGAQEPARDELEDLELVSRPFVKRPLRFVTVLLLLDEPGTNRSPDRPSACFPFRGKQ